MESDFENGSAGIGVCVEATSVVLKKVPRLHLVTDGSASAAGESAPPESELQFVSLGELGSAERTRVERLLGEVCPNAGVLAIALSSRVWDVRPIVAISGEGGPSIIRLAGPEVTLDVPLSERVNEVLTQLKKYPDLSSKLLACGTFEGQLWYRRAFIDRTVADVLMDELPQSRDIVQLFGIAFNLIDEVANWHSRGVIHGHITPSNIHIGPDGGLDLLDAAIGNAIVQATKKLGIEEFPSGYLPNSFAPESLTGAPISTAVDIFGLGSVLRLILARIREIQNESSQPIFSQQDLRSLSDLTGAMTVKDSARRPALGKIKRAFGEKGRVLYGVPGQRPAERIARDESAGRSGSIISRGAVVKTLRPDGERTPPTGKVVQSDNDRHQHETANEDRRADRRDDHRGARGEDSPENRSDESRRGTQTRDPHRVPLGRDAQNRDNQGRGTQARDNQRRGDQRREDQRNEHGRGEQNRNDSAIRREDNRSSESGPREIQQGESKPGEKRTVDERQAEGRQRESQGRDQQRKDDQRRDPRARDDKSRDDRSRTSDLARPEDRKDDRKEDQRASRREDRSRKETVLSGRRDERQPLRSLIRDDGGAERVEERRDNRRENRQEDNRQSEDPQAEKRHGEGRHGDRRDARRDNRVEGRNSDRKSDRSGTKPEPRADQRQGQRTEQKHEQKPEQRHEQKSAQRQEQRQEQRSQPKHEQRPEAKTSTPVRPPMETADPVEPTKTEVRPEAKAAAPEKPVRGSGLATPAGRVRLGQVAPSPNKSRQSDAEREKAEREEAERKELARIEAEKQAKLRAEKEHAAKAATSPIGGNVGSGFGLEPFDLGLGSSEPSDRPFGLDQPAQKSGVADSMPHILGGQFGKQERRSDGALGSFIGFGGPSDKPIGGINYGSASGGPQAISNNDFMSAYRSELDSPSERMLRKPERKTSFGGMAITFAMIFAGAGVIYYTAMHKSASSGIQQEYVQSNQMDLGWSSRTPSGMIPVVLSAIDREHPNQLAEMMILKSAMQGETNLPGVDTRLLKIAFDPRWEASLSPNDRRSALAAATAALLGDRIPADAISLDVHPGVLLAFAASLPAGSPQLARIPLESLTNLPLPYGPAFGELQPSKDSKLTARDEEVRLLARISTRGIEDSQTLASFLSADVDRRLRALARAYSEDGVGARQALDILINHPNIHIDHESIKWGKRWNILSWSELENSDQLMILAGMRPSTVPVPSHLAILFTHPSSNLRIYGMDKAIDHFKFEHPGAVTVLNWLREHPEDVAPEQTGTLAGFLESPDVVTKKQALDWLASNPSIEVVSRLLLSTAGTTKILPMDPYLTRYLFQKGWNPELSELRKLTTHPDRYTRLYSYSKVFEMSDHQVALAILTEAKKKEKDQQWESRLDEMIKVLTDGSVDLKAD